MNDKCNNYTQLLISEININSYHTKKNDKCCGFHRNGLNKKVKKFPN